MIGALGAKQRLKEWLALFGVHGGGTVQPYTADGSIGICEYSKKDAVISVQWF